MCAKETEPNYLTPNELADRWRTSAQALSLLRCKSRGPAYQKLGKRVLYRLDDVVQFERDGHRVPGSQS